MVGEPSKFKASRVLVTVYCIVGALCCAQFLMDLFDVEVLGLHFVGHGAACFVGGMLASLLSMRPSRAEEVVAATLVGAVPLVMRIPMDDLQFLEFSTPLSTALVCAAAAVAGSRVGARWKLQGRFVSFGLSALCGFAIVGAFCTHFIVLAFVFQDSMGIAIALQMLMTLATPGLVGWIVQMQHREPVESYLVGGLALLSATLAISIAIEIQQPMILTPLIFGLTITSGILYGCSLLGVMSARSSERWINSSAELPPAVLCEAAPDKIGP